MRPSNCLALALLIGICCACDAAAPSKRQVAPSEGDAATGTQKGQPGGEAKTDPEPNASGGAPAAGGAETARPASGGAGGDSSSEPEPTTSPSGTPLSIEVRADAPTFVSLASASEVELDGATRDDSSAWDLVFQGWDIFTNGGASGGGKGAAFGPLPFTYFLEAEDPKDVPFLIEDQAAGAFRDWYFYDGTWHTLYSRFHVYGVKTGGRLFKLQLLGYYGDVQGAPISALYHLRYAEVTPDSSGTLVDVAQLDATAGGLGGGDATPSGCFSLLSGQTQQLTSEQAAESTGWDLRFHRDAISVNGGLGGPGSVVAVDLDAGATEAETLELVKTLTPENQAGNLAAVDYAALNDPALKYRGDRIVSAFTDAWAAPSEDPPALAHDSTWLVLGADGKSRFLIAFESIEDATSSAAGKLHLRIVKVR